MATAPQTSHAAPQPTSVPGSNARMEGFPDHLTTGQQQAQRILKHLLEKLQEPESRYYERYGKWVKRHSKLEEICFRCVRPHVWRFLDGKWNLDALKLIGGDIRSPGPGIYFDGILSLDKRVRYYIGQSSNLGVRISQHWNFRYRRDNPSLHYYAMQQSIYNVFGILATLPSALVRNHAQPGMDCPDLLLNVLEMWMCLVFKCLPEVTLGEWLPQGEERKGQFGMLNIASPLDNGERQRVWVDLSRSEDSLVQDYLSGERKNNEYDDSKKQKKKEQEEKENEEDKKNRVHRRTRRDEYDQLVIQVPAQAVFLVGAAFLVGWVITRSSSGPRYI